MTSPTPPTNNTSFVIANSSAQQPYFIYSASYPGVYQGDHESRIVKETADMYNSQLLIDPNQMKHQLALDQLAFNFFGNPLPSQNFGRIANSNPHRFNGNQRQENFTNQQLQLQQQQQVENQENLVSKQCNNCMNYLGETAFVEHLLSHLTQDQRQCPQCQKTFNTQQKVKTHIKSYHGKNSFHCSQCDYVSKNKSKLNEHIKIHLKNKPYPCTQCEKSFSQKNHLMRHNYIHTGERTLKCHFCEKNFYRKDKLDRHERTHTGLKPYHCKVCDKTFLRRDKLTKHVKMHLNDRPFKCGICDIVFAEDQLPHKCKKKIDVASANRTQTPPSSGTSSPNIDLLQPIVTLKEEVSPSRAPSHPSTVAFPDHWRNHYGAPQQQQQQMLLMPFNHSSFNEYNDNNSSQTNQ